MNLTFQLITTPRGDKIQRFMEEASLQLKKVGNPSLLVPAGQVIRDGGVESHPTVGCGGETSVTVVQPQRWRPKPQLLVWPG